MKVLILLVTVYIVFESAWLYLQKGFYTKQFALFAKNKTLAIQSMLPVALVYVLLLTMFYYLVLLNNNTLGTHINGLLFGAVAYGVYNLTNKATLPGYSWTMVLVDTAWGAFIFGALGWIARLAKHRK